ncbi:hypothetical protein HL658_35990 [Azospirillum sp. RWY-5-1]|uniref:Carrier domain-containing protein n=1 Tax=Azospirillum oleiclasticum TaxID=2735135 RepID=A0ABX2TGG3_9PROT|nr:phosphopantetheine-binding protein [Azospirillum oleiclasticum]NYZ17972.1 hypothetical protein [Azospirillum oleiclasticum]NYZ22401.1 hypothetical protein [Azospirillum oleiclasticum]
MTTTQDLDHALVGLFETDLNVAVPSADTDLLEGGLLNSVTFVELVMLLEERFGVTVPIDDIEVEQFRTIHQIALFVGSLLADQRRVAAA